MTEPIRLLAELFIYLSLLLLTCYTVIFGYHWFSYGTSRTTSLSALVIFLIGAGGMFLTLIGIYQFL